MNTPIRRFCLLILLFSVLTFSATALFTLAPVPSVEAQSCDDIPQGGGESISASITTADAGQTVSGTGVVPQSTWIEINAMATALGQCIGMGWNCQQSPASARKSVCTNGLSTTSGSTSIFPVPD